MSVHRADGHDRGAAPTEAAPDWREITERIISRYAPAIDTSTWWEREPEAATLALRAYVSAEPADLAEVYRPLLPAYRAWYLRPDDHGRPTLEESLGQLRQHMPELLESWEELRESLAGQDDVLARFLTAWDPPSLLHNCSSVLIPGERDSGGSQFFIAVSDQPALDGQYTVFARVAEGINVAQKISTAMAEGNVPVERIEIRKASIRDRPAPLPEPFVTETAADITSPSGVR